MAHDNMIQQWERTCQSIGGSKGIIVPSEVISDFGLTESDKVIIALYYRYSKDKSGNILCNKEGNPIIERKYCSFWKKGE